MTHQWVITDNGLSVWIWRNREKRVWKIILSGSKYVFEFWIEKLKIFLKSRSAESGPRFSTRTLQTTTDRETTTDRPCPVYRLAFLVWVERVEQRASWDFDKIGNQIISKYFIFKCLIEFLPIYRFLLIFVGFWNPFTTRWPWQGHTGHVGHVQYACDGFIEWIAVNHGWIRNSRNLCG